VNLKSKNWVGGGQGRHGWETSTTRVVGRAASMHRGLWTVGCGLWVALTRQMARDYYRPGAGAGAELLGPKSG
jgi:hypothetical protein